MEFKTTDTRYTAPVTRVLIVTPARCIAGSKTNTINDMENNTIFSED